MNDALTWFRLFAVCGLALGELAMNLGIRQELRVARHSEETKSTESGRP
jgi:hypothetical protein